MTEPGRIDTHQHLIPPFYRELLDRGGLSAGGWPSPAWDAPSAIAMMDDAGIDIGILSLSAPGVNLDGHAASAAKVARDVNDFGAELAKDRPDRFGQFATLPLVDIDDALEETRRVFDELHADGVVLLSNERGVYLGDPRYEPLWEELDRRNAVVFIHPTSPPIPQIPGMPGPVLDYPFDTTRTAVHMVYNGVLSRHPELRVILSHAGGFLPYAAYRFQGGAAFNPGTSPESIMADLRRFYFDTAISASPSSLPSLLAFADPRRITYGSDYPFAPTVKPFNAVLASYDMPEETRRGIYRENAERLFPRLAAPTAVTAPA